MWDESKQIRIEQLRKAEVQGTLTKRENAELATLIAERCHDEKKAIEEATRQREEKNARTAAEIRQVQAQNRELEALIREQEAYLALLYEGAYQSL